MEKREADINAAVDIRKADIDTLMDDRHAKRKADIVSVEPCEGVRWDFVAYNGITMPKPMYDSVQKKDLADHMRDIEELSIRDDDVVLVSYPRSGTHWVWEIMNMLLKGTTEYEKSDKNYLSLDLVSADIVSAMPSPRVLNTHFLPRNLPKGVAKGNKIVHVQRNAKDVFASVYQLLVGTKSKLTDMETFDRYLKYLTGTYGVEFFCSWAQFVKSWEQVTVQHPDQILNIFYEDLKEDPVREIRKINKFLRCNRDDDIIRRIADACSFTNMKEADLEKQHIILIQKGGAHRKGLVGDWKNTITVAQNIYMDQWLESNLSNTNLKFRYELL